MPATLIAASNVILSRGVVIDTLCEKLILRYSQGVSDLLQGFLFHGLTVIDLLNGFSARFFSAESEEMR